MLDDTMVGGVGTCGWSLAARLGPVCPVCWIGSCCLCPPAVHGDDRSGAHQLGLRVGENIRRNFLSERIVVCWNCCPGSAGVTIPAGVPEPWRCGTEGCAQQAALVVGGRLDWVILEVSSNLSDSLIIFSSTKISCNCSHLISFR